MSKITPSAASRQLGDKLRALANVELAARGIAPSRAALNELAAEVVATERKQFAKLSPAMQQLWNIMLGGRS